MNIIAKKESKKESKKGYKTPNKMYYNWDGNHVYMTDENGKIFVKVKKV